MDDQTNRLVNNRYRLLRLLGEGGMAQVWLAQDESLERQVALKRLRPQFAQDASLLARFRREARTVARLNSPYIVQIYDVGMNEQDSFIVMEFVDGHDLKKLLRLQAPLSVDETLELMRAITAGVVTAHEAGLIHRDLKPANILISKRGQIKISDFGIARDLTKAGMTQPGTIWGTSDYMAPEQAMGEEPAPTMDVYSLGVMMFEMLSGERPYTGRDATAVMMAHINKPVPSLRRLMPSVPEHLSRLVVRLMSKNPASRPQDAGALLKILNNYGGSAKTTILHPVVKPTDGPTVSSQKIGVNVTQTSEVSETSEVFAQRTIIEQVRPTGDSTADDQPDLVTRKVDPPTGYTSAPVPDDQSDLVTRQLGPDDQSGLVTRKLDPSTGSEQASAGSGQASAGSGQAPDDPSDSRKMPPPSVPVSPDQKKTPPVKPVPSSPADASQGPTRHWGTPTPPPADQYASKPEELPTRHWGTGTPGSALERSEGPTRHWATPSPQPATNKQSDTGTRHAGRTPATEDNNNNRMLMIGGGVALVLLLLCLVIGLANGGLNAIIGGDSATSTPSEVVNAPATETVTKTVVEPTVTPTATELPPTDTPTEEPATATATEEPVTATSTATTEPPTETPTLAVEPSATATIPPVITIEPILSTVTVPPTFDPYPAPEVEPTSIPPTLSGARQGNAPDAYVLRAPRGINLDGYLNEWDLAQSVDIEQPVVGRDRWYGRSDLRGTAYFTWDETYFYMAIRRTDNEHLQTRTGHELYRDDSVELWLDFDLYGDLEVAEANGDDYQFVFSAGDFDTLPPEGVTYYPDRGNYQLAVAAAPLGKSYRLEARIPWAAVGVTPFDGMELGYAVVLNDNDSPQEESPKTQVSTSRVEPFANPTTFGNMFLLP